MENEIPVDSSLSLLPPQDELSYYTCRSNWDTQSRSLINTTVVGCDADKPNDKRKEKVEDVKMSDFTSPERPLLISEEDSEAGSSTQPEPPPRCETSGKNEVRTGKSNALGTQTSSSGEFVLPKKPNAEAGWPNYTVKNDGGRRDNIFYIPVQPYAATTEPLPGQTSRFTVTPVVRESDQYQTLDTRRLQDRACRRKDAVPRPQDGEYHLPKMNQQSVYTRGHRSRSPGRAQQTRSPIRGQCQQIPARDQHQNSPTYRGPLARDPPEHPGYTRPSGPCRRPPSPRPTLRYVDDHQGSDGYGRYSDGCNRHPSGKKMLYGSRRDNADLRMKKKSPRSGNHDGRPGYGSCTDGRSSGTDGRSSHLTNHTHDGSVDAPDPVARLSRGSCLSVSGGRGGGAKVQGCDSRNTASTQSDGAVCRICHDTDSPEVLVSPCYCAGSLGLIHISCLQTWLGSSNKTVCEICKFQFQLERRTMPFKMFLKNPGTRQDKRNMIFDVTAFLFVTPITLASAYLCIGGAEKYFGGASVERSGLLTLAYSLIALYLIWFSIALNHNMMVWRHWKNHHQNVTLICHPHTTHTIVRRGSGRRSAGHSENAQSIRFNVSQNVVKNKRPKSPAPPKVKKQKANSRNSDTVSVKSLGLGLRGSYHDDHTSCSSDPNKCMSPGRKQRSRSRDSRATYVKDSFRSPHSERDGNHSNQCARGATASEYTPSYKTWDASTAKRYKTRMDNYELADYTTVQLPKLRNGRGIFSRGNSPEDAVSPIPHAARSYTASWVKQQVRQTCVKQAKVHAATLDKSANADVQEVSVQQEQARKTKIRKTHAKQAQSQQVKTLQAWQTQAHETHVKQVQTQQVPEVQAIQAQAWQTQTKQTEAQNVQLHQVQQPQAWQELAQQGKGWQATAQQTQLQQTEDQTFQQPQVQQPQAWQETAQETQLQQTEAQNVRRPPILQTQAWQAPAQAVQVRNINTLRNDGDSDCECNEFGNSKGVPV